MNFKTQEIKRIIIKSPLIPLLPVFDRKKITKGETIISSLLRQAQDGEPVEPFGKGRSGGIYS